MTTKKRSAKRSRIPETHVQYLLDGKTYGGDDDWIVFSSDPARVLRTWNTLRDELLADRAEGRPGTRPWGWWRYDAPRWSRKFGAYFDGTLPEPRQRLGGTGTPAFEALAYIPSFVRGIPDLWVTDFDVAYYNGRAVNVHGSRIGAEYKEGNFPHQAIDPADPPVFESEAAYLKRLDLFLPGEEKRLPADAFEPEAVR